MSVFSKILGKVKDIALPVIGTALGGPLGGALGGTLAGAIGHGKPSVGNVLTGAATGTAAGLLGGTSAGHSLLGGLGSALGGGAGAAGAAGAEGAAGAAGGSGWGNILKIVGGDLLKVAPVALAGYSAVQGAKQAAHGEDLQNQALDYEKQRDAELSPLRTAGIQAALSAFQHPVTPYDAVGGYVDAGNPYSRTPAGAPTAASVAGGPLPPGASPASLPLTGVVPLLPRTAKPRLRSVR